MPNWRAVGFGVMVEGILAFTGVLVPIVGHAMIGVAGGFAAGILGGGGPRAGVGHGGVTGVLAAFLVTVVSVGIAVTVGFGSPIATILGDSVPLLATVFDLTTPVLLVVGALAVATASLLGGVLGAAIRGDAPLPATPPEERGRNRP